MEQGVSWASSHFSIHPYPVVTTFKGSRRNVRKNLLTYVPEKRKDKKRRETLLNAKILTSVTIYLGIHIPRKGAN